MKIGYSSRRCGQTYLKAVPRGFLDLYTRQARVCIAEVGVPIPLEYSRDNLRDVFGGGYQGGEFGNVEIHVSKCKALHNLLFDESIELR